MTRQLISTNKQPLLRSSHAKRPPQNGFVQVAFPDKWPIRTICKAGIRLRCSSPLEIQFSAIRVYRDLAVSVLDFAQRNCGSADEYSTDDVRLTSWNILSGHARHRDEGFGFVARAETLATFSTPSMQNAAHHTPPRGNSRPSPRAILLPSLLFRPPRFNGFLGNLRALCG